MMARLEVRLGPPRRGSPWRGDGGLVFVAGALVALGAVLCSLAWTLAASRGDFDDQVAYVTLAVGGLVTAFFGQTLWLLRGRRSIGGRLQLMLGGLVPAGPPPGAGEPTLVGGPGLRWYHSAGCALAAGQGWPVRARVDHEAAGRRPCGVCRP